MANKNINLLSEIKKIHELMDLNIIFEESNVPPSTQYYYYKGVEYRRFLTGTWEYWSPETKQWDLTDQFGSSPASVNGNTVFDSLTMEKMWEKRDPNLKASSPDKAVKQSLEKSETQSSESNKGPMGSFDFGDYGKIWYVKRNFLPFYLPSGNLDIGKLFGLADKPNHFKDEYGWHEAYVKKRWDDYDITVTRPGIGQNDPYEELRKQGTIVKRYYPADNWETLEWVRKNKIPYAFSTSEDKLFVLAIKLVNLEKSLFPEVIRKDQVPLKPMEKSRGWNIVVPGMSATSSRFDLGSAYFNVKTGEPYNQTAPTVEDDPSTFDLDTRTDFVKFMGSWQGMLAQVVASLLIYLVAKKLVVLISFSTVPGSFGRAVFTSANLSPANLRLRLVLFQTIGEIGLNSFLAYNYVQAGPEYESMAFITMAFCAWPAISAYCPGLKNFLGTEYSNKAMLEIIGKQLVRQAMSGIDLGVAMTLLKGSMQPEEWAVLYTFMEAMTKPELQAELKQAFKVLFETGETGFYGQVNRTLVSNVSDQGFSMQALRQKYAKVLELIDGISDEMAKPNAKFLSTFTKSLGTVVVYQKVLINIYDRFSSKPENKNKINDQTAQQHAQNSKAAMDKKYDECPGWEKKIMLEKDAQEEFSLRSMSFSEDTLNKLFENGVFTDEATKAWKETVLLQSLVNLKKRQQQGGQKVVEYLEGVSGLLNYFNSDLCWETDVVSKNPDLANQILEICETSGYVLTDDDEACKKKIGGRPINCLPCIAKSTDVREGYKKYAKGEVVTNIENPLNRPVDPNVVKPVEPKPEEWTGTNWEKTNKIRYMALLGLPDTYEVYSAGTPPNIVYYSRKKQTNQFTPNTDQQYPTDNTQLQQPQKPQTSTEPQKPGIKQKFREKFGKRIDK